MNDPVTHSYSYQHPQALLLGTAVAMLGVAVGMVIYSQISEFAEFIHHTLHGFAAICAGGSIYAFALAWRSALIKPSIVLDSEGVTAPKSVWFGGNWSIRYCDICCVVITEPDHMKNETHRFLVVEADSGEKIKMCEAYFRAGQFEELWSVLDYLARQKNPTLTDAIPGQCRALCSVCRQVILASETDRCERCASLTINDIRRIGLLGLGSGLTLIAIAAVLAYLASFAGLIILWTGLALVGIGFALNGGLTLLTGKVWRLDGFDIFPPSRDD